MTSVASSGVVVDDVSVHPVKSPSATHSFGQDITNRVNIRTAKNPFPAAPQAAAATSSPTVGPAPPTRSPLRGPIVISVEAAIGTGKSTLLRLLQQHKPDWVVVQEPVELWQNVSGEGHNLLDAFYKDSKRYSFSFQTYCVLSRIEVVTKALEACQETAPVVVLERSWFSDRHTFGEMLQGSGNISPMEWSLYDQWYRFAIRNAPVIDGHVYLECNTDTCMARLRKRSRSEEVGVTENYQRDLIAHHEQWLGTIPEDKVYRLNVDNDFASTDDKAQDVVAHITAFIDHLASSHNAAVAAAAVDVATQ